MSRDAAAVGLFVVGYPAAIVVITRWVPVVRERRTKWFVIHQAAVAAIVAGQALKGNTPAVLVNGAWFVVAAIWYATRRPSPTPSAL
jgi:hypothetical protein